MGYDSTLMEWPSIKEAKLKRFREMIRLAKENPEAFANNTGKTFKECPEWTGILGSLVDSDTPFADINDYTGHWYDDEGFARFLAPYAKAGNLVWNGEDNTTYGYIFDGKGGCWKLEIIYKKGFKIEPRRREE